MSSRLMTILMVDDDPDDRLLARDAFIECGLPNDFRTAADGEDLLDYLNQRGAYAPPVEAPTPGLILLDLNMPRMDGREAIALIKSNPALRHIPVVIMSTSKVGLDVTRSYDLGANSFVPKPTTFAGLVAVLESLSSYWFNLVVGPSSPTPNQPQPLGE